jgi:hypothetical protein
VDLIGPARFARFAYPPNTKGYCGPDRPDELFELAVHPDQRGEPATELRRLATVFEGAFPYLQLLSGCNHRDDPLDADVVEAYWIGNELLAAVPTFDLGRSIDDRFRRRAGRGWGALSLAIPAGCANHAFHVLVASPWVGLLREGIVDEPLAIIDQCRVSWGRVLSTVGDALLIERTPLVWDRDRLGFGTPENRTVASLVRAEVGDIVATHWGWACERLTASQARWLRRVTESQLLALSLTGRPIGDASSDGQLAGEPGFPQNPDTPVQRSGVARPNDGLVNLLDQQHRT